MGNPRPDTLQQADLVRKASELESSITNLRRQLSLVSCRGEALRRAILSAAFSGRLTGHRADDKIIEEEAAAHVG